MAQDSEEPLVVTHATGAQAEPALAAAEHYVALDDDSEAEGRGDNGGSSEDGESDAEGDDLAHIGGSGLAEATADAPPAAAPPADDEWVSFSSAAHSHAASGTQTAAATPAEDEFGGFCGAAEDAFGATSGSFAVSVTTSFVADFGEAFGAEAAPSGAPAGAGNGGPPLAASDVALIKETMAALVITPPPWIRKMAQLQVT